MRDLDMNQPASGGEEEEFPMGSVEEDDDERGAGAGGPHRSKKLRLSNEQSRLLEESFRLNHTLTSVSQHYSLLLLLAPCSALPSRVGVRTSIRISRRIGLASTYQRIACGTDD